MKTKSAVVLEKPLDTGLIQRCVPCRDTLAARQQDAMYGPAMRVHNALKNSGKDRANYRCAVCGSVKGG